MGKIKITNPPENLDRICAFLKSNTIHFKLVDDYGNHSLEDSKKYKELLEKFK